MLTLLEPLPRPILQQKGHRQLQFAQQRQRRLDMISLRAAPSMNSAILPLSTTLCESSGTSSARSVNTRKLWRNVVTLMTCVDVLTGLATTWTMKPCMKASSVFLARSTTTPTGRTSPTTCLRTCLTTLTRSEAKRWSSFRTWIPPIGTCSSRTFHHKIVERNLFQNHLLYDSWHDTWRIVFAFLPGKPHLFSNRSKNNKGGWKIANAPKWESLKDTMDNSSYGHVLELPKYGEHVGTCYISSRLYTTWGSDRRCHRPVVIEPPAKEMPRLRLPRLVQCLGTTYVLCGCSCPASMNPPPSQTVDTPSLPPQELQMSQMAVRTSQPRRIEDEQFYEATENAWRSCCVWMDSFQRAMLDLKRSSHICQPWWACLWNANFLLIGYLFVVP